MGKTLEVIGDRSNRPDDLVAAREILDVHYSAPISLRAAKLLHLLVDAAGVDVVKPIEHVVPIQSLNIGKDSKEEFLATVEELFSTTMRLSILNRLGKKATKLGSFLADAEIDEDNLGDLRFEFSKLMRQVIANSNTWGVLSARAVIAFRSRYSLRLYEFIAGRINQQVRTEKLEIFKIREILDVPPLRLSRWKDLRVRALDLAIDEVNQLAGFKVHYKPLMRARAVWAIQLSWDKKERGELADSARELDASKIGRKARRDGSAETVMIAERVTFPASGSIEYAAEWVALKRAAGCNMDNGLIADKFRKWCAERDPPVRLEAGNITELFSRYCQKVGQV
jgi:hypothetical protein